MANTNKENYKAIVFFNGSYYYYKKPINAKHFVERLRKRGYLFEKHTLLNEFEEYAYYKQIHFIKPERWFAPRHYVK